MQRCELHDGWTVTAIGDLSHVPEAVRAKLREGVPATVPGCVHTDLLATGLIPDPYVGRNELDVQWIGETSWQYAMTFDVDGDTLAEEHVELVCDGLDTVAAVEVNGQIVGECFSQHIVSRFDAKPALRAGQNTLVVRFASPLAYARQTEARLGPRLRAGAGSNISHPMQFIRKMACNFGWDWGPMFVTAGIWRPIRLETWSVRRLVAVRPHVLRADSDRATLAVTVETTYDALHAPADATVTLTDPQGGTVATRRFSGSGRVQFDIVDPQRWWPRGHGEQPLYTLEVTLTDQDGVQRDVWQRRIGLRTTELVTEPDDIGERFALRVNGREVYVRGANWIPDDCFPNRVDADRYRRRIDQACDLNMNLLRVWGGGVFESDTFYDLCDERGVLVWQDFLFACGCYPEEDAFAALVEQEVTDNVNRLASHPSLVIWNGCNENLMMYWHRAVKGEIDRPWGLRYYFDLFPKVLERLDPTRPFWPASPYSGTLGVSTHSPNHGNVHFWGAWHGGHWSNYRKVAPRFCSEFGWQGPPAWSTMTRVMDPIAEFEPGSAGLLHRQRSPKGEKINAEHAQASYNITPTRENFDDWHYLLQLEQARAKTIAVEWYRSRFPVNMGAIYWQLNDCWPVTSWAVIDSDERYRPAAYATRRFFRPRLVTIQPISTVQPGDPTGPLAVYLHNDSGAAWNAEVRVERHSVADRADADAEQVVQKAVTVEPWSLQRVELPGDGTDDADHYLVAHVDDQQTFWFFARDKEIAYPTADFDAKLDGGDGSYTLTIIAKSLLRDLCVFVDRLDPDATIDDQVVTLLPGQRRTFTITSAKSLTVEQLTQPPVLQCANRFGKR